MEFTIKSGSPEKQRSACVVVGVFDNRKLSLSAELIDRASQRLYQRNHPPRRHGGQARRDAAAAQRPRHARRPRAAGRPGQGARLPRRASSARAIRSAVRLLNETGSYEAVVYLTEEKVKRREVAWRVEHAVVVAMEAVYRFEQMKSQPAEVRRPLRKLTLSVPQRSRPRPPARPPRRAGSRSRTAWTSRATSATCRATSARPTYLGERAQAARRRSFPTSRCKVLERKEIEELGMGSFLSVTNGSDAAAALHRPRVHAVARKQGEARACWSARASRSTPAASRSSRPPTWTR